MSGALKRNINIGSVPPVRQTDQLHTAQCYGKGLKRRRHAKIAIVTGTLDMGGAELIMLNLGRVLTGLGHDATIVTTSRRGQWFQEIKKNGIRSLHIDGRFQAHPYRHAWRVGRRLRNEGFDVVILTKFVGSERFAQAALNMLPNHMIAIPWIHNDTEQTYRTALTNEAAWNVGVGVGVRVAATAAKKTKHRRILHIPNGLVPPPDKLVRSGRGPEDAPFRLCYLGRMLHDQKGIFHLPMIVERCLRENLNILLDLVGDGPDRVELRQRFEKLGLMDRVMFHGAIPNEEVYAYLCRAHVLLMPSRYEAMPCVPIEAQLCGCVPLVSQLTGVTDTIVEDGITGFLIEQDNARGFAEATARLCTDRAQWKAISEAGKRNVRKFTVEAMGQRFDQLIQACLRGEYPLQHPRRKWLPVNPLSMYWREAIPRSIHRLGLGKRVRIILGLE